MKNKGKTTWKTYPAPLYGAGYPQATAAFTLLEITKKDLASPTPTLHIYTSLSHPSWQAPPARSSPIILSSLVAKEFLFLPFLL